MRLGSRSVLGRVSPLDMKREAVCACVCLFCSVFCRNGWTDRTSFWHRRFPQPFVHRVLRKLWYLLIKELALEVFLNDMRYINPRFTYLLTYLLTLFEAVDLKIISHGTSIVWTFSTKVDGHPVWQCWRPTVRRSAGDWASLSHSASTSVHSTRCGWGSASRGSICDSWYMPHGCLSSDSCWTLRLNTRLNWLWFMITGSC